MRNRFIVFILMVVLLTGSCVNYMLKVPIEEATITQIEEVCEIGPKLAEDIFYYVRLNPDCKIEDLEEIKYISTKRIKQLKRAFR